MLREANIELFKTLTPEQWKHHGMHAERGVETVEHIVRLYAGHDLNHTHQVEQILGSNTVDRNGTASRGNRRRA